MPWKPIVRDLSLELVVHLGEIAGTRRSFSSTHQAILSSSVAAYRIRGPPRSPVPVADHGGVVDGDPAVAASTFPSLVTTIGLISISRQPKFLKVRKAQDKPGNLGDVFAGTPTLLARFRAS